MPTHSTTPSADELAFLQERVANFGLFGAGLSLTFWLYRLVEGLLFPNPRKFLIEPSFGLHAVAWLLLLAIWVLNRSGTRSHRFINIVEGVGVVGACLAYVAMGTFVPLLGRPEMIVLGALTLAIAARAAYVPSSARRTFGICVAVGIPYVLATYESYTAIDEEIIALMGLHVDVSMMALGAAINAGVWWTLSTALATGITHVIYGLRREVRGVKKLGQYTLEEKLGEGGMGVVYRAQHGMLRRPTAIKLLHPDASTEAAIERFAREVRLTARLTHPNTVTIYDYGRTPDGLFYYAMELLDGAHLGEIVAVDGAQSPGRVIEVLTSVASALTEAHGVGLIHRDIKPANIVLSFQGGVPDVAKVVDFGLVKDIEKSEGEDLTKEDTLTGTPQYMAPEAITNPGDVDARSDIYALGAVGYFLVTGTHVFSGSTIVEVCSHHLHTKPEPPSARLGATVPADLEALLLACLQKDPRERPQTAGQLTDRLRNLASAGEWSEGEANAWWEANRRELALRYHPPSSLGHTRTLDVEPRLATVRITGAE